MCLDLVGDGIRPLCVRAHSVRAAVLAYSVRAAECCASLAYSVRAAGRLHLQAVPKSAFCARPAADVHWYSEHRAPRRHPEVDLARSMLEQQPARSCLLRSVLRWPVARENVRLVTNSLLSRPSPGSPPAAAGVTLTAPGNPALTRDPSLKALNGTTWSRTLWGGCQSHSLTLCA